MGGGTNSLDYGREGHPDVLKNARRRGALNGGNPRRCLWENRGKPEDRGKSKGGEEKGASERGEGIL